MGEHPQSDPGEVRRELLVLLLVVLGGTLHLALFHALRHDDAFITFRYARNLATGQGFVFNPNERVLGTTSPLFSLLLAAAYPLVGDGIAAVAIGISACAVAAQGLLVYGLACGAPPITRVVVAGAVSFGLGASSEWLALETHLAYALGLGSLLALRRGRPRRAGLWLGLAFLTRHDMALWAPLLLWEGRRARAALVELFAVAASTALPWLAFATFYFGWPLPRTLGAKLHSTASLAYASHYLDYFTRAPGLASWPLVWRALLCGVGIGAGVRLLWRRARGGLAVPLFAGLLLLTYSALGPPARQHWHLYGATVGVRATALMGLLGGLELALARVRRGGWLAAGAGALVGAGLLAGLWQASRAFETNIWLGERHRRYTEVARFVQAHAPRGARFMATEVGTLGYLTDRTMIDPFGLINWTNAWPRSMRPEDYMDLIVHYRPGLVLFDSPEALQSLSAYAPQLRYRVLRVFDWRYPFSTVAVLEPTP